MVGICVLALGISACGSDVASPASAPTTLPWTGGPGALPPLPLDQRVGSSDLIITGTVESIDEKSVRISIDEVLMGDAEVGGTISVSSDVPHPVGLIKAGDGGMWLVDTNPNPPVLNGGGPYDATTDDVLAVLQNS